MALDPTELRMRASEHVGEVDSLREQFKTTPLDPKERTEATKLFDSIVLKVSELSSCPLNSRASLEHFGSTLEINAIMIENFRLFLDPRLVHRLSRLTGFTYLRAFNLQEKIDAIRKQALAATDMYWKLDVLESHMDDVEKEWQNLSTEITKSLANGDKLIKRFLSFTNKNIQNLKTFRKDLSQTLLPIDNPAKALLKFSFLEGKMERYRRNFEKPQLREDFTSLYQDIEQLLRCRLLDEQLCSKATLFLGELSLYSRAEVRKELDGIHQQIDAIVLEKQSNPGFKQDFTYLRQDLEELLERPHLKENDLLKIRACLARISNLEALWDL